jgi:hypothetical protein
VNLDIDGWLRGIGLPQYSEMFRANDIDGELLRRLTNDDLKDIGVGSFGHRKKLLEAIAELAGVAPTSPQPALTEPKSQDTAERRQVTRMIASTAGRSFSATKDIRHLVREAAEMGFIQRVPVLDADGKPTGRLTTKYGTDGELGYLKWLAENHAGSFAMLYSKLLPLAWPARSTAGSFH